MFAVEAFVKHRTQGWSGLVISGHGQLVTVDDRGTARTVAVTELYEPLAAMCATNDTPTPRNEEVTHGR